MFVYAYAHVRIYIYIYIYIYIHVYIYSDYAVHNNPVYVSLSSVCKIGLDCLTYLKNGGTMTACANCSDFVVRVCMCVCLDICMYCMCP